MKITRLFVLLLVIQFLNNEVYSQTFEFYPWELNKIVTISDVVRFLDDEDELITYVSSYKKGEEIKYTNENEEVVTLSFFENTQVLKKIYVYHIVGISAIHDLMKSIFSQLGEPFWGYEMKIFTKTETQYFTWNLVSYEIRYKYRVSDNIISFYIFSAGIGGDRMNPTTFHAFSARIEKYNGNNINYYPSLEERKSGTFTMKYELLNKW